MVFCLERGDWGQATHDIGRKLAARIQLPHSRRALLNSAVPDRIRLTTLLGGAYAASASDLAPVLHVAQDRTAKQAVIVFG
jgi:hypothetical protein